MTGLVHRIDGPPDAPLLVLSNSLGTTMDLWEPQMRSLTGWFRVLRYEHPGHGGSATPDPPPGSIDDLGSAVVSLLDGLGEERVSICGVSLGGMVAMWLAARHPERVDRVVLANTAAYLPPASAWEERADLVMDRGVPALMEALLGRWFTPGFVDGRPDVRSAVSDMLHAASPEGYAGCCRAIGAMDLRGDLAAIAAPTLVVGGAGDPVTTPAMSLELAAAIPGASLTVLPDAAHLSNLQQPHRFNDAVLDHLAGSRRVRGEATRRSVLGDAHVERTSAPSRFRTPFVDHVTSAVWGDIWSRPGLERPMRSAVTLAALTATGSWEELELHLRGAVRCGLTLDQVVEILLHTGIYAGVPKANHALSLAERIFDEDQL